MLSSVLTAAPTALASATPVAVGRFDQLVVPQALAPETGLPDLPAWLQQSWAGIAGNWSEIMAIGAKQGADISMADLLSIQGRLLENMLSYEVAGKVIGRAVQNLEQLTRMQ